MLGGLNMDLVMRAPRFPAPGETINGTQFQIIPGGKGANQAVAMSRLGAGVTMVGRVGSDEFGSSLRANLAREGVDVRGVMIDEHHATGVALITVEDAGENMIIVAPGANNNTSIADFDDVFGSDVSALVMPLEVPVSCIMHAAASAKKAGALIVLNAAPAQSIPASLLLQVDYLIANETEATLLAGTPFDSPADTAAFIQAMGVRHVIITLGANGALLAEQEKPSVMIPAFAVPVVDTTAAGDAFVGAFTVGLLEGLSARGAVGWANAASALSVARLGTQTSLPNRAELDAFLATKAG